MRKRSSRTDHVPEDPPGKPDFASGFPFLQWRIRLCEILRCILCIGKGARFKQLPRLEACFAGCLAKSLEIFKPNSFQQSSPRCVASIEDDGTTSAKHSIRCTAYGLSLNELRSSDQARCPHNRDRCAFRDQTAATLANAWCKPVPSQLLQLQRIWLLKSRASKASG